MMNTFRKNGFIKVKKKNLLENINFYHCCELTTQNMKSQLSTANLKIPA